MSENDCAMRKGMESLQAVIAAAEERGRRKGVEERDELRALLAEVRSWILAADRNHLGRRELLARIDAALAPRDSGTCGADEDGIHREARKDRK